jgi:hypothetical protein
MNNDEYCTWEYVMGFLTEEGEPPLAPGMYHEGLLEFHEDKIKADPKMFENSVGDAPAGGHRVWSVRSEGAKWWYMVSSEAFKELVLMAAECQERRNAAQGVESHQQLYMKWQESRAWRACEINENE